MTQIIEIALGVITAFIITCALADAAVRKASKLRNAPTQID